MKKFEETVKFVDGRYQVGLPWKSDVARDSLKNNEGLARKRLESLDHKLMREPNLQQQNHDVFSSYEREGIIEEVPSSELISPYPAYYMPHRPVVRESSVSTKDIMVCH